MHFIYYFILFLGLNSAMAGAPNKSADQNIKLTVKFNSITTKTGVISLGLYKDKVSFDKKKPFKAYKISKSKMLNGKLVFTVNLPKGTYGIAALDDTNNSGDMDYNFFGYPLEGFGFSNYFHSGLLSPQFKSFSFSLMQSKSVTVKMKYM